MTRRFSGKLVALLLLLASGVSLAVSDEIQIQAGRATRKVGSRVNEGKIYYRLSDIAKILDLRLQQRGVRCTASGPRGSVELTAGRPLARIEDQYVMLASPVWARSGDDWYVSEDFMTKAAPLLLDGQLEKVGDRSYRLGALDENEVQVQVVNYPDHVSVIFLPSRGSEIRVKEFQRQIRVEFDKFRVRPQMPANSPDSRLVSALRFASGSIYGVFEIEKGPLYNSYREYTLNDPLRRVIGIYGPPLSTAAPDPGLPPGLNPVKPDPGSSPLDEEAPEFERPRLVNVVTIDAGHGGENYGVHPTQEVLEKNFALRVALKLRDRLKETGLQPALTRTRDLNLSAEQRSAFGNQNKSRAFVSIHFGGSALEDLGGPVVYVQRYMSDPPDGGGRLVPWTEGQRRHLSRSRDLAERLQSELNRLFGKENRVAEAPLTVLEPLAAPAVLIEAGFLTNRQDRERLMDPEFEQKIADSIAKALTEFLQ